MKGIDWRCFILMNYEFDDIDTAMMTMSFVAGAREE